MALLVFVLSVYGLATAIAVLKIGKFVFGESHPKERRRFLGRIPYLGDLFYCPPCLSFWIGMAVSYTMLSPSRPLVSVWWHSVVLDGLVACAVSWILFVTTERTAKGLDL